jgi:hypothetical protein
MEGEEMKLIYRKGFGVRKQTINLEFQAGTDIADAIDYALSVASNPPKTRVTFEFNGVTFDTDSEPTECEMWNVWYNVVKGMGIK